MDQALKRHVMNQAALVQIGIGEISTVAQSVARAVDANEDRQAEQLGNVIVILCERLMQQAERIEIDVRGAAEPEGAK